MSFDPYRLLGVAPNATVEQVRQTYRKLARKFHPDINPDPGAAEQFKEMGHAFAVLSDATKRALFDEFGEESLHLNFDVDRARRKRSRPAPARRTAPRRPTSSGRRTTRDPRPDPRQPQPRQRPRRPAPAPPPGGPSPDVTSPLEVDLDLALTGGDMRIPSPVGGAMLTVHLPPGVKSGTRIRLAGRGRPGGRRGAKPGDLFLEVRVKPHPFFERSGDDLLLELPLTLGEAYHGAEVEIPTLDGWLRIRIPAGSRGGERLRLQGNGLHTTAGSRGDMYVHLCVRLPDKMSAATRSLDQLSQLYSEPVRKGLKL